MKEDEYYNLIENFNQKMSFEEIHDKWFKCFSYILKSYRLGYTNKIIKSLFYHFDMDNWKAMHKENTEYKDCSKEQLIDHFCGECSYICDRTSYDRLFRTHWLFKKAFSNELWGLKIKD